VDNVQSPRRPWLCRQPCWNIRHAPLSLLDTSEVGKIFDFFKWVIIYSYRFRCCIDGHYLGLFCTEVKPCLSCILIQSVSLLLWVGVIAWYFSKVVCKVKEWDASDMCWEWHPIEFLKFPYTGQCRLNSWTRWAVSRAWRPHANLYMCCMVSWHVF
jgi:hypothetical protein